MERESLGQSLGGLSALETYQWVPALAWGDRPDGGGTGRLAWESNFTRLLQGAGSKNLLCPESRACLHFLRVLRKMKSPAIESAESRCRGWLAESKDFLQLLKGRWFSEFGEAFSAPLDASEDLVAVSQRMRGNWRRSVEWSDDFVKSHGVEPMQQLRRGKQDWMATWKLGDEAHTVVANVVFDAAVFKFGTTGLERSYLAFAQYAPPWDRTRFIPSPMPVKVTLPAWDPALEARANYEQRAREAVAGQLQLELDRIEKAVNGGGARPRLKRGDRHFQWLARYHVDGQSYSQIAADVGVKAPSVRDGVHEAADLLGLPLRNGDRRGRPAIR